MMALILTERFYKSGWVEYHHNHCSMRIEKISENMLKYMPK